MLTLRKSHASSASSVQPPVFEQVRLNFDQLQPYEPVQDQFQRWGIRFEGAIALYPSNLAFTARPEALVIMPTAGRSSIVAQFQQPQRLIGAAVVGARQVKLTAFDRHQSLAQQQAGVPQYLQLPPEQVASFAQHQLELVSKGILKAEFCSDAPFVLLDFFCG